METNPYAIPNLNYFISIDIFKRYFESCFSDLFKCLNVLVSHTIKVNGVQCCFDFHCIDKSALVKKLLYLKYIYFILSIVKIY